MIAPGVEGPPVRGEVHLSPDATHYLWGNGDGTPPRRLVRTTDVLGRWFPLKGDPEVLAFAAARGTAIHRAVELMNGGGDGSGLDERTLDDRLWSRVAAYRRFVADSGVRIITKGGIEAPVFSLVHGVAGRFDILVTNLGRHRSRLAIIDVKSGEPRPSHQLQTAAYRLAFRECRRYRGEVDRYALYLQDTGTPDLVPQEDPTDERAFLGLLAGFFWMQRQK